MEALQVENTSKEDLGLFNTNILERLSNLQPADELVIRPLMTTDYEKGFIQLLGQLTEVGNITKEQFLNRFWKMKATGSYYVIVVEDTNNGNVIGSATLVLEQKFIHKCALLAHHLQCYKLSLDCRDTLVPFYESLGFKKETGNGNHLNVRFHYENTLME